MPLRPITVSGDAAGGMPAAQCGVIHSGAAATTHIMIKRLSKILAGPALCVALAGCAVSVPPASPEQIAAAKAEFANIDWGVLKPYISQQYINTAGSFLFIRPAYLEGGIDRDLYLDENLAEYTHHRFKDQPTETPNTYLVTAPTGGWTGRAAGRLRIDSNGQGHVLDKSLNGLRFNITAQKAEIAFGRIKPRPFVRDMYVPPKGKPIPVSYEPDSAYQKLRAGKQFGTWEDHLGKTFVGKDIGNLLTVSKDDAGNLVLTYTNLANKNPVRAVISPPPDMRVLAAPETKKPGTTTAHLTNADHLLLQYYDGDSSVLFYRGSFAHAFVPRGDRILRNSHQEWQDSERRLITGIYEPITEERIQAARAYNLEQARLAERRRQAAEARAARSQANQAAFIAGLSSGFAQARQVSARQAQSTRDFERRINNQVRAIEQQNNARAAATRTASPAPRTSSSATPRTASGSRPTTAAPRTSATASSTSPASAAASQARSASSASTRTAAAAPGYTPASSSSCRYVDDGEQKAYGHGPTRAAAESNTKLRMCPANRGRIVLSMQCKEEKQYMKVPVPGNPLKFTREERPSTWACNATYRCQKPKQVCDGSSRGVRQ